MIMLPFVELATAVQQDRIISLELLKKIVVTSASHNRQWWYDQVLRKISVKVQAVQIRTRRETKDAKPINSNSKTRQRVQALHGK